MKYTCPVCLFDDLEYPPKNYEICPCCGTEFGNDDELLTFVQLRQEWVRQGAPWFFREPPQYWNPWIQLINGGHAEALPRFMINITAQVNITIGPSLNLTGKPWAYMAA